MVNQIVIPATKAISHSINPLVMVGIIFGGMVLFLVILLINAKFRIFQKIKTAFTYQFKRTKALKVNMIYRNGQTIDFIVTYDENDTFDFENGVYNINPKSFVNKRDKSEAFYFYGCPDAILFDYENTAKGGIGIDSVTYKKVLNEKIIKDLLEKGKEEMFLIIVLIIVVINLLMTGMILFGVKLSTSGVVK
jgi:hypothetical protein